MIRIGAVLASNGVCWQARAMDRAGIKQRTRPKAIDPRAVRTFGAVCRAGSISGAARVLAISQPSVSNTIARLEAQLGVTLFERSRSGIVLTPAGEALERRAAAMETLLEGAVHDVAAAFDGRAGRLRVGGTPGALVSLLPRGIEALERDHPGIALTVVERADSALIDMLRKGTIDLAFVTTEIDAPPLGIREITLARDSFALIVGAAHADLPDPVSLADLAHLPWVLPEAGGAFRRQVDALFIAAGIAAPRDAIRCDSLLTTKAIVRTGRRVTILPREVNAAELSNGLLRAVGIVEAGSDRAIGARLLADVPLSPATQSLLESFGAVP
jgi:DNA-binding transcriptional LysR family regulator